MATTVSPCLCGRVTVSNNSSSKQKVSFFQPQQHKVEGSGNECYHQLVPVNDPLTSGGCHKLRVTNSVKLQILEPVLVATCGGNLVSLCQEMRKEER